MTSTRGCGDNRASVVPHSWAFADPSDLIDWRAVRMGVRAEAQIVDGSPRTSVANVQKHRLRERASEPGASR